MKSTAVVVGLTLASVALSLTAARNRRTSMLSDVQGARFFGGQGGGCVSLWTWPCNGGPGGLPNPCATSKETGCDGTCSGACGGTAFSYNCIGGIDYEYCDMGVVGQGCGFALTNADCMANMAPRTDCGCMGGMHLGTLMCNQEDDVLYWYCEG